jgi:transposase-like protein
MGWDHRIKFTLANADQIPTKPDATDARGKTVLTEVGPVDLAVPRDRDGTYEPQIVKKRQRRLSGVEDMVISLSAKGLTTGEISAHLAEVYGAEVSRQTISTITGKVVEA